MPSGGLNLPDIEHVYTRFAALMTVLLAEPGGRLVLYSELDADGVAAAMASNVAGAASLGIEPEAARAKQALRAGVCDFVVNNLNEALRILKNEIRKKRGVSVVLIGEREAMLAEIVERGVQPDVMMFQVTVLMERGARLAADAIADELSAVTYKTTKEFSQRLAALDRLAMASLDPEVMEWRRRWIEASPRYLGRMSEGRYIRMRDDEADRFVATVREEASRGEIPAEVVVTRGGKAISITG